MSFLKYFNRAYKPTEPRSPKSFYRFSGGKAITEDSCMEVSAFNSGVVYIATQIAKLPWKIKDKDNKDIENSISVMLNLSPNEEVNSMFLRIFLIISAIVTGNGYCEIERDVMGRPKKLWPIPSNSVMPTRIDGVLWYRIIGGDPSGNGGDVLLKPSDIFHIKNFHTKDGINGQGVVAYATETLGISLGSNSFANSLFANGAMPAGFLEVEGRLTEDAALRLKETWDTAHSGRRVGGTAVLEDGVKFNPAGYDPQVLQFLETRKFSVLEIARFLRIPPSKLYATEATTYNNVEQANLEVVTDTLDAWARNFEIEADIKILNKQHGGRKTEMDMFAIFRGDMDSRSNYYTRMMNNGAMSPNEIRKKEGAAPYDGGDEFYIATNNFTPVNRLNEVIDSQIANKKPEEPESKKTDEAVVAYLQKRTKH